MIVRLAHIQRGYNPKPLTVPGWSGHVNGDTPDGLDQEHVFVPCRQLLALVRITFGDVLNAGVKRFGADLEYSVPQEDRKGNDQDKTYVWCRHI